MDLTIRLDLLPAYGIQRYLSPFMTAGRILQQDILDFTGTNEWRNYAKVFWVMEINWLEKNRDQQLPLTQLILENMGTFPPDSVSREYVLLFTIVSTETVHVIFPHTYIDSLNLTVVKSDIYQ